MSIGLNDLVCSSVNLSYELQLLSSLLGKAVSTFGFETEMLI